MTKTIRNTTASTVFIGTAGVQIAAGATYSIKPTEFLTWAADSVLDEVTPLLTSGDLIVNDGVADLDATNAVRHLSYPDTAFNVRFLSDSERINGFVSKTVQEAIEEAKSGSTPASPTTTVGAVTATAYTVVLTDNSAYQFDARIIARRTDVVGEDGDYQIEVRAKRESAGSAAIAGNVFQKRSSSTFSGGSVSWDVSGNSIRLRVTGVDGKTIKWQPQVEVEKVS